MSKLLAKSQKKRRITEEGVSTDSVSKTVRPDRTVTYILAIDVETTGPNVLQHWMPEFGAVLWKIGEKEPANKFYACLAQPHGTDWDATTLSEFWNNESKGKDGKTPMELYKQRVAKTYQTPHGDAMALFVKWARDIESSMQKGEKVLIVTDTAAFDTTWMNVYLARTVSKHGCDSLNYLFGKYRPTRDIDAFKFGMGKHMKVWGSEQVALSSIDGIDEFPEWVTKHAHNHNPVSDAKNIAAQTAFFLSHCQE